MDFFIRHTTCNSLIVHRNAIWEIGVKVVKVLKILGWLFVAIMGGIALLVGALWATGQFKQTTIELDSIVFEELVYDGNNVVHIPSFGGVEDKTVVLNDFESTISFSPANATNKTLRLQVTKGASLVSVPDRVTAGSPFVVHIVRDENGMSAGGEVEISAFDTRGLTATSTPLTFFIDQPVTSLTTTLNSVYQYTNNEISFAVRSNPSSALSPTKEPNKYTNANGNVVSSKPVTIETYDSRPGQVSVITNLKKGNSVVDLVGGVNESRWTFGVGRDGSTTFVVKTWDTYNLWNDYTSLNITQDNFESKMTEANAFLNKYIEKIRSFHFDYDVDSMTTGQVVIGNKYKVVRTVDTENSTDDDVVYTYDYQIMNTDRQYRSGKSFIDLTKMPDAQEVIEARNYETFMDAVEYLYVMLIQNVSVVNAEAVELISNSMMTMDVHDKQSYTVNELKEQLGVRIIPNESSANLDNRIADVKAYSARFIDGAYYLEDYEVRGENQTEVERIVELLNSEHNVANTMGHAFDVLKISNKAQDASVVVTNPTTNNATWNIAAYNKLPNVTQKVYIVFTYLFEGKISEDSTEDQELMYYALMEVKLEQQEVETVRFNYEDSTRYNNVILSTDANGTRIGNVTFGHSITLPSDLASIHSISAKPTTYTTIKYFALASTVLSNGRYVINVDSSRTYTFDGHEYYEITSRDVATGNVRIEAQNASVYENEHYLPVEIYAYVVKTDIDGNVLYDNGSYIPVCGRSANHMEYTVRPFLNDLYVYTNFDGEYLLRNSESIAYNGLYDVDGTVYKDETRAQEQASILGTTVNTIIRADRNIKVLVDQEFDVLISNKILHSNGTDYRTKKGNIDYTYNDMRALEDADLLSNISKYMWFLYDGKEYDLEGYEKGTNPTTNPGASPIKFYGVVPFSLLSTQYDSDKGLIVVTLKANTTDDEQYLDFSYRRVVDDVDDANGNALTDTITIDARIQVDAYYLELAEHTSILAGYGAANYVKPNDADEDIIVWADRPYLIPVSGKVAGMLESWQVTNYASLSDTFKAGYVAHYPDNIRVDEDGTIGGNYPFSLKALQFNFELDLPAELKGKGIAIEEYPDMVVHFTPYLATKEENNGVVTFVKGNPATEYVLLTPKSDDPSVALVTFLKAPTTEISILFECDIYLYETSTPTQDVFQNKFYQKHFSFTSNETVLTLIQQDPLFDLLQFDENGLVIASGEPVSNSRQTQSVIKGGTTYNLNGNNGAVRVGFRMQENNQSRVEADANVFSACTFTIDHGSEDYIYFLLDGREMTTVRTNGEAIGNLSIGARSTNVGKEASFSISLLGVTVKYYVTVSSNVDIKFNENGNGADGTFVSYEETKTIKLSQGQTIDLANYFTVSSVDNNTASTDTYMPVFYMASQEASNYFMLNGSVLTAGNSYEDKTVTIAIHYQVSSNGTWENYTTTSVVNVTLKGTTPLTGVNGSDYQFDSNHTMTIVLSNGEDNDLSGYITLGEDDSLDNYTLSMDTSSLSGQEITELFGTSGAAINGWTLSSNAYYKIVSNIPVSIMYNERVRSGNAFVTVQHDTGYRLLLTLQPSVTFGDANEQTIVDNSTPSNPEAFGTLALYEKDNKISYIQLLANGNTEVLYYGYESAELLQNGTTYSGDVLSIDAHMQDNELVTLIVKQNRSVEIQTNFVLKIYTKYGVTLELPITVTPNYVARVNYPFHGSKTDSEQREEIKIGTSINLLQAYVNNRPRIEVYQVSTGELVDGSAKIFKSIQAFAGSTNITEYFTVSGSIITLNKYSANNNYITLEIELFNGLVVTYDLERIVGNTYPIRVVDNTGAWNNETGVLTIYGGQPFSLSNYLYSEGAYFAVLDKSSTDDLTIKVEDSAYEAYYPITSLDSIKFDDVNDIHDFYFEVYSRYAVAGETNGVFDLHVQVVPNIKVVSLGNALPANHEVNLADYLIVERGYEGNGIPALTFGEDKIVSYTGNFTISEDDSKITYNSHVFTPTNVQLALQYKNGLTYTLDMTVTPDVNFNFNEDGNTYYGSTKNSTYTLTNADWTKGKGYTDYLGGKVGEDEIFTQVISFQNNDDAGKGVTIDNANQQVTVGAINTTIQLVITVTYTVDKVEGSLVQKTILTILPNVQQVVRENVVLNVQAGQSLTLAVASGEDSWQIKAGDRTLLTLTQNAYKDVIDESASNIDPTILFDFEEASKEAGYQDILTYVFVDESGNICFRNTNERITLNIPFRMNLQNEDVTYDNAYQNSGLYVTVNLHPSVANLGLSSTFSTATSKENAYDLLQTNKSNQVNIAKILTLTAMQGVTGQLSIAYLYPNFTATVANDGVWYGDNNMLPVASQYVANNSFVSYNKGNGILTFAPSTTSVIVRVTLTLSGTQSIDVYIRLNKVELEQESLVNSKEEQGIEESDRTVKITDTTTNVSDSTRQFTYKITLSEGTTWVAGNTYTFDLLDFLNYKEGKYSKDAFLISTSTTSTSNWISIDITNKTMTITVPNDNQPTPDDGRVEMVIGVGLDNYTFVISF